MLYWGLNITRISGQNSHALDMHALCETFVSLCNYGEKRAKEEWSVASCFGEPIVYKPQFSLIHLFQKLKGNPSREWGLSSLSEIGSLTPSHGQVRPRLSILVLPLLVARRGCPGDSWDHLSPPMPVRRGTWLRQTRWGRRGRMMGLWKAWIPSTGGEIRKDQVCCACSSRVYILIMCFN